MNTTHTEQASWYREPYVWLLIAFPLSAVLAGIYTIMLAVSSNDGLVVDDYYKEGLEINRRLERDRKAVELQLKLQLQHGNDIPSTRIVLQAGDDFVYPETLNVSFLNASRSGMDQVVIFQKSAGMTYDAPTPKLVKGKWHVTIENQDWRLLDVLYVP